MKKILCLLLFIMILFILSCDTKTVYEPVANRDNWIHYQHDFQNSGVSSEQLEFPLYENWIYQSSQKPNPAWPEPALRDYYHEVPKLEPLIVYDRVFHTTIMDGFVYFASSTDNKVYCIDEHTGEEVWSFFTGSPNRTVPTLKDDRLYFGSDDGFLYCLNRISGELIWKYKPVSKTRKIMGNGRMISWCPVRTAPVFCGDTLIFAAGLFPRQAVYVSALNSIDGSEIWKTTCDDLSPQGYPVISEKEIYIPSSRSRPRIFKISTGEKTGKISSAPGGDYLTVVDGNLVAGRSNNQILQEQRLLKTAFSGHQIKFNQGKYFVGSEYYLTAIDTNEYNSIDKKIELLEEDKKKIIKELEILRDKIKNGVKGLNSDLKSKVEELSKFRNELEILSKKQLLWKIDCVGIRSMILTANSIIVGQDGFVKVFDQNTGNEKWTAKVDGVVYGLAVSGGRLVASTAKGKIYSFSSENIRKKLPEERNKIIKSNPVHERTALALLDNFKVKRGICLSLDMVDGNLAYEIIKNSEMNIIGVAKNQKQEKQLREKFDDAGMYGSRITIYSGNLKDLGFSDYFANLIVSENMIESKEFDYTFDEIYPLLAPSGGMLCLGQPGGHEKYDKAILKQKVAILSKKFKNTSIDLTNGIWLKIIRPKLEGSGEWTHLYANPENSASSGDKLLNDNLTTLWFGEPGPRQMVDRHHRMVPPLFKNGILYIPGYCRLVAANAYNGTKLWEKTLPRFDRLGIFRDACNYVVTDELLYIVDESRVSGFDPATGEHKKEFVVPQLYSRDSRYWGYLAAVDDKLLGSGRKPTAEFTDMSYQADNELWYDYQRNVTSDYIFCQNRFSGQNLWQYKSGIILNPSIACGGGRMYFLESKNKEAMEDTDGLLQISQLLKKEAYITALDLETGKVLWQEQLIISPERHHIFLAYSEEKLVCICSKNDNNSVHYDNYAYEADTGKLVWHQEQTNENFIMGGHGEQHRHPAIVKGILYSEPYAYDLHTGKPREDWRILRNGHGCGTISASEENIFYRAGNPALCNLAGDESTHWINSVSRPGCWINIIPAGGIVMIPEASSGCTCDFPLQTSFAYIPQSKDLNVIIDADSIIIDGVRKAKLSTFSGKGKIYYTIDGKEPSTTSNVYTDPIKIKSTKTIKAIACQENEFGTITEKYIAVYAGLGRNVILKEKYRKKYNGNGKLGLTDGEIGTLDYKDSAWQGYKGNNLDAIIDLGENIKVKKVSARFLNIPNSWIFLPENVEFLRSNDGKKFTSILKVQNKIPWNIKGHSIEIFDKNFENLETRYIRVIATNVGICPEGHPGAGGQTWLFADEIIIE